MKKFIIFSLAFVFLFAGCRKAEEQKTEETKNDKKESELIKKVDAELSKEVTDATFEKGKSLAGIKLKSLKNDAVVDLGSFKGSKVLIDFWSSWCIPCIEMFPDLNRIKTEYEDSGKKVKVITVSVDPMPQKVMDIAKEKNALFEILQAPETLQNAGILLPFTVAVDENGTVLNTTNGKHSFEELKKFLGVQ